MRKRVKTENEGRGKERRILESGGQKKKFHVIILALKYYTPFIH